MRLDPASSRLRRARPRRRWWRSPRLGASRRSAWRARRGSRRSRSGRDGTIGPPRSRPGLAWRMRRSRSGRSRPRARHTIARRARRGRRSREAAKSRRTGLRRADGPRDAGGLIARLDPKRSRPGREAIGEGPHGDCKVDRSRKCQAEAQRRGGREIGENNPSILLSAPLRDTRLCNPPGTVRNILRNAAKTPGTARRLGGSKAISGGRARGQAGTRWPRGLP